MILLRGNFVWHCDTLRTPAEACVVIVPAEFERLELRDFEPASGLSPCLAWCHRHLGVGGGTWELAAAHDADLIYFESLAAAERFHAAFRDDVANDLAELRAVA
jgi:hypothetical protein